MTQIVQAGDGTVLPLGLPSAGEVVIIVDARTNGRAFSAGTQTLKPGAFIPIHRHLERDEVWFIHKGQGRATVNGEEGTVVPGAVVYAPRQTWYGIRNTGTGALMFAWVSAPAGIEAFFHELSGLPVGAAAEQLRALAQRHGIELQAETSLATVPAPHRHRRRGGRGRRRGGRRPRPSPVVPSTPPPTPSPAPQPSHGGATREVYMSGRWVPVTGEGPVIAPGRERRRRHHGRRGTAGGARKP